jgi:D-sedoheptulose 7-phosphate isomerase
LIHQVKPDVLVKGGDWAENEIVGADFVKANGGRVFSLPLVEGYSSSGVIEKMATPQTSSPTQRSDDPVGRSLNEHHDVFAEVIRSLAGPIRECGEVILASIREGKKILVCGNGGSAADAQHIAAEFIGRYETERIALPAIALTTDTSALTAIANDYGFERVFARQVEALANEGDCLIAISTSGTSPNVIRAVMEARKSGCRIVGMTGAKGKKLAALSDACILVPSERTARIQEVHICAAHIWCEMVDHDLASGA